MSGRERARQSEYLIWAKTRSAARFNLATSAVADYPLSDLPVTLSDLLQGGHSLYGHQPVLERLAGKYSVSTDRVLVANGASMANYLVMAALVEPGDRVLVEKPTYEPLLATARHLGAEVVRFERRPEDDFRLNPDVVSRAMTSGIRLVVVCNPHNPTGALTDGEALRATAAAAERAGARVLVDEIYLDAVFERPVASAVDGVPGAIVTSSLTKAYGLGNLRCGWAVAEPELVRSMWRLNDLIGVIPPHPAERLSAVALEHLPAILERSRVLLAANRALLDAFLAGRDDVEALAEAYGTVVCLRPLRAPVPELCRVLREKYETSVVPGELFELPDRFRIGIGGPSETLREGLERLGRALDDRWS